MDGIFCLQIQATGKSYILVGNHLNQTTHPPFIDNSTLQ